MSGHHNETFITKYIFSQDHKMIAKQFLITGMIMAILGMLMSAVLEFSLLTLERRLYYITYFLEDGLMN